MLKIRVSLFLLVFFSPVGLYAQYIHYQGAVRNKVGTPLANRKISIRVSILDSSPSGSVEFWEVRSLTTTVLGMYSFNIGDPASSLSSASSGKPFERIDWSNLNKFLRVEIDPTGGYLFNTGVAEVVRLVSVPFAMYAQEGGTSGYNVWKKRQENVGKSIDDYLEVISRGTTEIADESIGGIKLIDGTITSGKIAPKTITDEHISVIGIDKLQPGSQGQVLRTTARGVEWAYVDAMDELYGDVIGAFNNNIIKEQAVTNSKIADGSVSADKLTAGNGTERRVGIATSEGKIEYKDFEESVQEVQKNTELIDGENTKVRKSSKGSTVIYSVNVSTAKGASKGSSPQLGLVKEDEVYPQIGISQEGALYLNEEVMNRVVMKDDDYTVSKVDKVVMGDASKKDITITLPSAESNKGSQITIKKQDTNEDYYIYVEGKIAGLNRSQSRLYTALPFTGWVLLSDGDQWQIINKF